MKQNSDKMTRVVVYTLFGIFVGVFLAYGIMYKFPAIFQETITKIEKDVTVTDEGIADAVEKVYDSVIIVSTYNDTTLYSSGSGFIYKTDDNKTYIITNNHVIESGNKFKITYTCNFKTIFNFYSKKTGSQVRKYSDAKIRKLKPTFINQK